MFFYNHQSIPLFTPKLYSLSPLAKITRAPIFTRPLMLYCVYMLSCVCMIYMLSCVYMLYMLSCVCIVCMLYCVCIVYMLYCVCIVYCVYMLSMLYILSFLWKGQFSNAFFAIIL